MNVHATTHHTTLASILVLTAMLCVLIALLSFMIPLRTPRAEKLGNLALIGLFGIAISALIVGGAVTHLG